MQGCRGCALSQICLGLEKRTKSIEKVLEKRTKSGGNVIEKRTKSNIFLL